MPVTIIGAFAIMPLLGFSVNLLTLFGLVLAIGIVVDDAIVIVENASHHIERGVSPRDATIRAISEVTGPVIGITAVLMSSAELISMAFTNAGDGIVPAWVSRYHWIATAAPNRMHLPWYPGCP